MKRNNIIILSVFCFAASGILSAQGQMGQWQSFLAYNNAVMLEQTPERVFVVAREEFLSAKLSTLFSIGIEDRDIQTYSKVTGLNDADIAQIKYDDSTKQLIIVYTDGNIDLMSSKGVVNIPDFYFKQMSTDKTINHINCYNGNAYLSTPFGIVVVDLTKAEISDTYYIGNNSSEVKVLSTDIFEGKIYACSADSVYWANLNSNLIDFQSWGRLQNLPGSGAIQNIAFFAKKLFIFRNGALYSTSDFINWEVHMYDRARMKVVNNRLYVIWGNGAGYYDESLSDFNSESLQNYMPFSDYLKINDDDWIAAYKDGVAILSKKAGTNGDYQVSYYYPNCPVYNSVWSMAFNGQKLYVLNGGRSYSSSQIPAYLSILENNFWKIITPEEVQEVTQTPAHDYVQIAFDPTKEGHYYVTSFGTGLYEFQDDKFVKRYINENTNGVIQPHPAAANNPNDFTRLYGIAFDKEGNLFIDNCGVNYPVKMRIKDGTWTQMNYTRDRDEWSGQMGINKFFPNQKWMISEDFNPGIFVFDDGNTLGNQNDDRYKFFPNFNYIKNGSVEKASPTKYYCFVQDNSGTIWIGTNLGPLIFNNTNNIFDDNYLASKILIPRNDTTGLGDFLLEGVSVKTIAVDGANRKWIGTETSGAFLVSDNGLKTIEHFTAGNSPLPSNNVQAIAINPVTGEVFFGTPLGLVSYQSDAAPPAQDFSKVSAFPNPVKPDQGKVTITGLMENSSINITDAAGNTVFKTNSIGSIATWNLLDNFGRRVDSGVYVIMILNEDGSKHAATKIMVFK